MKTCWGMMLVAATLACSGCDKEPSSPPAAAPAAAPAAKPASATDGYMGTLARGQQKAVKVIDVTALNEEVQLFGAQEGRLPKDLNELVTLHYISALPHPPAGMKIVYDAAQGKVSAVPE
jgi:hypothetical protein